MPILLTLGLTACSLEFNDDDEDKKFSATMTFNVELSGQQEVPAVATDDTASATLEYDKNLMQFRATLNVSDVEDFNAAHIHQGYVGRNGDVAFAFEASDTAGMYHIEAMNIDQSAADELMKGGWYINVHTADNPAGELRGQILSDDFTLLTFVLSGQQEVPMVDTQAMGYGYATFNQNTMMLDLNIKTMNAETANMAHIHTGRVGSNGGVLVGLTQGSDTSEWMTPDNTSIDQATLDVLLSGGHYVNVHTPDNPSGEIRGQILTDEMALLTFPLSGAQSVPARDTDAYGHAYAIVNTDNYEVELKVVTNGVDDATAAHIHAGSVGMTGGVVLSLMQSTEDNTIWMTADDASIDQATYQSMLAGGHYVNVHTPAVPSGEIRGQISQ